VALRAGNIFYFLFSTGDQGRIDAASIAVEDVAFARDPRAGDPYPQSMRISFNLINPPSPPRVRPLGPGLLSFAADPDPQKILPDEADVLPQNYANWRTAGTLLLAITDKDALARLKELSGLPVVPTHIWYSKVRLSQDFLFRSLPQFKPVSVATGRTTAPTATSTARGLRLAISGFLKGKFSAQIIAAAQQNADMLATVVEMPAVVAGAGGRVELLITAASDAPPFDGTIVNKRRNTPPGVADFYENPDNIPDSDPAHPRYGAIPARLVYRSLRTPTGGMIEGGAGAPVPDRVLAAEPTYFPVRFTRAWQQVEDRSVHFPSQIVEAAGVAGQPLVVHQRLACHGLLWLPLTAVQLLGGARFRFSISNSSAAPEREMRWLAGETADAWKQPASDAGVELDLVLPRLAGQLPHIILRRRMAHEVIYDRGARPHGRVCTYMSLRRTARAWVNNRIAGGRLSFEEPQSRPTRQLIRNAIGAAAVRVLDGAPDTEAQTDPEQAVLLPLMEALFPDIAPTQTAGPDPGFTRGRVAFQVWFSNTDRFQANASRSVFDDVWLGGGAAGAMLALDAAADYAVNLTQGNNESVDHFADRVVGAMLSGVLQPGAGLQFWNNVADLTAMRARNFAGIAIGHSPIFLRYTGPPGNPNSFEVLDQHGTTAVTLRNGAPPPVGPPWGEGGRRLQWALVFQPDVWVAANWTE